VYTQTESTSADEYLRKFITQRLAAQDTRYKLRGLGCESNMCKLIKGHWMFTCADREKWGGGVEDAPDTLRMLLRLLALTQLVTIL